MPDEFEIADETWSSHISKVDIQRYAEELADALNYSCQDSDLRAVVQILGGQILYGDLNEWEEHQSGSMIVYGQNNFSIYLSNLTSMLRDNFTIAHEIGHFILHSQCGVRPGSFARYGSTRLEWEANWFAAAFLMPKNEFCRICKTNNSNIAIAAHFNVSEQAVQIRKNDLGIS